jgi:hypothetical protein
MCFVTGNDCCRADNVATRQAVCPAFSPDKLRAREMASGTHEVSGHDFSRAEEGRKTGGLQPGATHINSPALAKCVKTLFETANWTSSSPAEREKSFPGKQIGRHSWSRMGRIYLSRNAKPFSEDQSSNCLSQDSICVGPGTAASSSKWEAIFLRLPYS